MRFMIWCAFIAGVFVIGCQQKSSPTVGSGESTSSGTKAAITEPAPPRQEAAGYGSSNNDSGSASIVSLDAFQLTAPSSWVRKPTSSQFVTAEFALPHAEGDVIDGRLTISSAGGSVEANIDRWKGQFKPQPKTQSQQEIDVAGVKATLVDLAGDFNDQRGPFAPGELRPNYRMIGAVVPAGGQLYFIKATGPEKTIASHAEAIRAFVQSAAAKK